MKQIVEKLLERGLIFKSLKEITPKELNSRKRVHIYLGVDKKDYYHIIIEIEKKSRILIKESKEFQELHSRLESFIESKITKKHIYIQAPLCSKAKAYLEESGWRVQI
jgi:cytidylate kinase